VGSQVQSLHRPPEFLLEVNSLRLDPKPAKSRRQDRGRHPAVTADATDGKQPVLAAKGDASDGALGGVVVDGQAAIVAIAGEWVQRVRAWMAPASSLLPEIFGKVASNQALRSSSSGPARLCRMARRRSGGRSRAFSMP
jgi:hypothetical protein